MDKCIRLFDLETKTCISRGFGHSELITGVHFTMDGKRLISTSTDGCIFVWKLDPNIVKNIKSRLSKKVGVIWPTSLVSEDYVKTPVKIKFDVNYDELPRWAKEQIDLEEKLNGTVEENSVVNDNKENNPKNSTENPNLVISKNNSPDKNDPISKISDNSNDNDLEPFPSIVLDFDRSNEKNVKLNNREISPKKISNKDEPLIKNVWEKVCFGLLRSYILG